MPGSRHLENGNGGWLPAPEFILQVLNYVVSLAVVTGLFAMMFKMLPDARIAWTDVWVGAVITAFLFTVGQFLIGLYLGKIESARHSAPPDRGSSSWSGLLFSTDLSFWGGIYIGLCKCHRFTYCSDGGRGRGRFEQGHCPGHRAAYRTA